MEAAIKTRDIRQEESRKECNVKLIATMIGLGLVGGIALAKDATTQLSVPGMDCDACTIVIKRALAQTKGVKSVDLNVDKRLAIVGYEDSQVTAPQIQKAIEKSGFKAELSKPTK